MDKQIRAQRVAAKVHAVERSIDETMALAAELMIEMRGACVDLELAAQVSDGAFAKLVDAMMQLLFLFVLITTFLLQSSGALFVDEPTSSSINNNNASFGCYRNTTDRGVGVPVSACASGLEKSGALCYPPCKANYTGVGPVCWQDCPPGYTDTGAFCQPDSQWGDNSACPPDDKCGLIYSKSKGCVKCPEGMEADGCICKTPGSVFAKDSYGRGAGVVMICAAGLQEQAGLCYTPCADPNATPVGPVCWASCPAEDSYSCGGAVCVQDEAECNSNVKSLSDALFKLTVQLAECIFDVEYAVQQLSQRKLVGADVDQQRLRMMNWSAKERTAFRLWHARSHGDEPRPRVEGDCDPQQLKQEIKEVIQQLNLPICNDV